MGIGIHQLKQINQQNNKMDQELAFLGTYSIRSTSSTFRWVQNHLKIIYRTTLVCEDGPQIGNTEVHFLIVDLASGTPDASFSVHLS